MEQEKHYCKDCEYKWFSLCKLDPNINYGTGRKLYDSCERKNFNGLCTDFKAKTHVPKEFTIYGYKDGWEFTHTVQAIKPTTLERIKEFFKW